MSVEFSMLVFRNENEYEYITIYVVWSASYASTKTLDSARGESHHPAFVGNWPTIIRMFLVLSTHCYWMSSPSRK